MSSRTCKDCREWKANYEFAADRCNREREIKLELLTAMKGIADATGEFASKLDGVMQDRALGLHTRARAAIHRAEAKDQR